MIFVDTSAIISLGVVTDKFHKRAIEWKSTHRNVDLITSNLVVIESLGWLRYKIGKKLAVDTGQNLLSGRGIVIERVTAYDELQAWLLFQKLDGRGISMIDTTSFVVMRRLKIKEVFAFDTDFKTQGFTIYPD